MARKKPNKTLEPAVKKLSRIAKLTLNVEHLTVIIQGQGTVIKNFNRLQAKIVNSAADLKARLTIVETQLKDVRARAMLKPPVGIKVDGMEQGETVHKKFSKKL